MIISQEASKASFLASLTDLRIWVQLQRVNGRSCSELLGINDLWSLILGNPSNFCLEPACKWTQKYIASKKDAEGVLRTPPWGTGTLSSIGMGSGGSCRDWRGIGVLRTPITGNSEQSVSESACKWTRYPMVGEMTPKASFGRLLAWVDILSSIGMGSRQEATGNDSKLSIFDAQLSVISEQSWWQPHTNWTHHPRTGQRRLEVAFGHFLIPGVRTNG